MRARFRVAVSALLFASSLHAQETITYGYDARGRLVQVDRTGGVNNGVTAAYVYDPADNRSSVTVTGAPAALPAFSISDASITEGGTLVFNVTKSIAASGPLTVSFATSDGTATAGSDYTTNSGSLSFDASELTKTVSVVTTQDSLYEGNENLLVTLSGASSGSVIADGSGSGTIVDDESPPTPPSFAISDASVTEGRTLVLTVTKTGATSSSFGVNFATANGTASAGSDYTANSGTLTFAPADTTKTINVVTIDDALVEGAEALNVNLSGATGGATISDSQGIGTINDNDTAPTQPTFTVSDASNLEGYAIVFTITRSGPTSGTNSISYATATGSAASNDFTARSGTLTFTPGQTTKTVSVPTTQDNRIEGDESFVLNLTNPTGGAVIGDAQGIGTIVDDDGGDPCPTCRG